MGRRAATPPRRIHANHPTNPTLNLSAGNTRSRRAVGSTQHRMSNLMEELLQESQFDNLKEGSIIKGTIIEIRPNEVIVDIGGKSEGIIPASEFVDVEELQVGQEIEVFLEKLEDREGNPVLSFDKAEQKKNWENILAKCEEGSVVQGRVKSKVKGGLIVSIGVDSFLPASQIDIQPPKNLDQYVGQTYDFKVLKINLDRRNIVVSRRELIEEQRQEKRRKLLEEVNIASANCSSLQELAHLIDDDEHTVARASLGFSH